MWPKSLRNFVATLLCTMLYSKFSVHASTISLRWLDGEMHELIDLGYFEILQWLHFSCEFFICLKNYIRHNLEFYKILLLKMKLSLFIAGVAFAAPNNVQTCMKHVINNDGSAMERAMGAVACLERSDAYIQPGQCWVQFLKVMSWSLESPG